jgi:iron complex transport system substrate-binding protein
MQAELAALPPPRTPLPVAVHYQRQGYVTGTATLMDDMMKRAGLRNLASRLGDMELAHVDLETIIAARPDYIVFTAEPGQGRDWGALLLGHPALAHAFAGRTLYIPDNLTVCGGPEYPLAVASLAAQLRGH